MYRVLVITVLRGSHACRNLSLLPYSTKTCTCNQVTCVLKILLCLLLHKLKFKFYLTFKNQLNKFPVNISTCQVFECSLNKQRHPSTGWHNHDNGYIFWHSMGHTRALLYSGIGFGAWYSNPNHTIPSLYAPSAVSPRGRCLPVLFCAF